MAGTLTDKAAMLKVACVQNVGARVTVGAPDHSVNIILLNVNNSPASCIVCLRDSDSNSRKHYSWAPRMDCAASQQEKTLNIC